MESGKKRVLVVEDDPSIAMGLELNLVAEGYDVDVAQDGRDGLARARKSVDLVILDVMLPGLNGLEVVKTLRGEGNAVPVIMLSARGAEMDKVMGLELGAEDYITKPFSLAELLARVKAVLRRDAIARGAPPKAMRAGELDVDATTREVRRNGQLVELTATEFDILFELVQAGGKVLTREQIQARVWGPTHHGTPRTIDNFVLQLRTKLEEDSANPKHLVTVRGVGYRFVTPD